MKLSFDQVKEITTGAVNFQEENTMLLLKRFTQEQEMLYKETNQDFYDKTFYTSGIKFLFKTDSKNLFLKLKTMNCSTRKYFSVDVFVDGNPIGYIDNFSNIELPQDYTQMELPLGDFSKKFQLGEGEKTVCVHLPWSVKTLIEEISIDDNAFIEAVKPKKKLIAYGDSITHGYDALRPSNRYIAKVAELLGAEEFNKAIGGERFFPQLAKLKESFAPDYITVAYGTNDWSNIDEETFKYKCKAFYTNISQSYPDSKIFAITPIWRKDMGEYREFGYFEKVEQGIRKAVTDIENITVISGFDFVPKEEKCYADLRLHPNDDGFACYAENLYREIKTKI
ncbi:MAG: SGNH/GDSL hydrolase family protein [Clostridia bacterium]|nr:SGNH/GDSL hydrolase family protein [Clostridia bacterium]